MHCNSLQDAVVFLQLQALGSCFLVLGGNIAAGSGHAAVFMLGAFHYYLNAVSFLGHFLFFILVSELLYSYSFFTQFFHYCQQSVLVDRTYSICCQFQRDPAVFFRQEKTLRLQIRQETA